MPSLILTGYPSTGKTTFATLLAHRAQSHKSKLIQSTIIINEQSARPDKTIRQCYADSTEEKLTRSALKSEFDRYVKDKTKLVILDSMNYIKGFRYELHCISKAAGQKHGVVWLICRENAAKFWNQQRSKQSVSDGEVTGDAVEDCYYCTEMMDELMQRYEPPDQRNRWDRPLYRVDVHSTLNDKVLHAIRVASGEDTDSKGNQHTNGDDDETGRAAEEVLSRSVYNMHSLSDAIRDPSQSKVATSKKIGKSFRRANTGSRFKRSVKKEQEEDQTGHDENAKNSPQIQTQNVYKTEPKLEVSATSRKQQVKKMDDLIDAILDSFLLDVEPLKEGVSTKLVKSANSDVLHNVDSISQETMNIFLVAQQANASFGGGGTIVVKIGTCGQETCSMQMKRSVQHAELKRLRRQFIKQVSTSPPTDTTEEGIAKAFLLYIENQI